MLTSFGTLPGMIPIDLYKLCSAKVGNIWTPLLFYPSFPAHMWQVSGISMWENGSDFSRFELSKGVSRSRRAMIVGFKPPLDMYEH